MQKQVQCEVCGYVSGVGITRCAANSTGCSRGIHNWCSALETSEWTDKFRYVCSCCREELTIACLANYRRGQIMVAGGKGVGDAAIKNFVDAAATAQAPNGGDELPSRTSSLSDDGRKEPQIKSEPGAPDKAGRLAGTKRASKAQPPLSRPAVKLRVDAPAASSGLPDLLSSTMAGLQQERQRHKASRETQAAAHPHAESESRSEQRLKQRALKSHPRVPASVLWAQQQAAIAASLKEKPLWQGSLIAHFDDSKESLSIGIAGYGIVGNVHAMDAAMRLPKETLEGILMPTRDALEMSPIEAGDNAALIFKAASNESSPAFLDLINNHLFPERGLLRVLLGDDKPIWMAIIPGPDNTCLGVFVRFAEKWSHSNKAAGPGLLRKEGCFKRQNLTWPDQAKSIIRATACERGPGPQYTPGHVYRPQEQAQEHVVKPRMKPPAPGPLSDMSIAIVGFLRDHEAMKELRRKLREAGAQTFTNNSPWPGCVNVMVFPEQMVEKDLGLENSAPKEMQPVKDFLLAKGTRFFMKIDYPSICIQLRRRPTREEEFIYKIRELWPEGIQVTADAQTLHAAASDNGSESSRSLLDQIFEELEKGAAAARDASRVWMLSIAAEDLKSLETMNSPAFHVCKRFMHNKRCGTIDSSLTSTDVLQNAVRLAHFFRWYCRHAVLLVRSKDEEVREAAECKRTVHCTTLEQAAEFLQHLRI